MRLPTSATLPLRRPRTGLAALILLFIALAVLLLTAGPAPAQAQTSVKLVGNTGQVTTSAIGNHRDAAQGFSTGAHVFGYTLTEVQIDLKISQGSPPSYEVEIWSADSNGRPSSKLGALTKPSTLTSGLNSFTSASGIDLQRSTTYVVVIDLTSTGGNLGVRNTASDGEDPGGASWWAISDNSMSRGLTQTQTSDFGANSSGRALKIAVHGYESPPGKLVGNLEQTSRSGADNNLDFAQQFNTGPGFHHQRLTGVSLKLLITTATAPTYTVSIYTNSSNAPNTLVATLTNPPSLPTDTTPGLTADQIRDRLVEVHFEAVGDGISLKANTPYHVVFDVTAANGAQWYVGETSVGSEDPGRASGWGIEDDSLWRSHDSADWSSLRSQQSRQIAVHGYLNVPFSSVTAADRLVRINFKHDRSGCPQPIAWIVTVDGASYNGVSSHCRGREVQIWLSDLLAPRIDSGRTVTLSYRTDLASFRGRGSEISIGGVRVGTFHDLPVTTARPSLSRATVPTVNDKTLTLTFNQVLDGSSVPANSAFKVITEHRGGHGLRPCINGCTVAVTGVSLSGATATLTLEETIPHHGTAYVEYLPPDENFLQNGSGSRAGPFGEWATVLTPDTAGPVFFIAGLSHVTQGAESYLGIQFNEPLDRDSLPASSAFQVTAQPGDGAARTISGTGTLNSPFRNEISVKLAEPVARGELVTVSYVKPDANWLRDSAGNAVESFSGEPVNNGRPSVLSTVVSSDPGDDGIYERGEKFRVQVTFSEPVIVSGSPRLRIILGRTLLDEGFKVGPWKYAHYESGSPTPTLTFAYTVGEGDYSGDEGIAVQNHSLELNGGRIASLWQYPLHSADLSGQEWKPYDPNHRVDGRVDEAFWTATLDPKKFGAASQDSGNHYFIGCRLRSGSAACWSEGRLEPETAFTHAGVRNSFYWVFNHQSPNGAWDLTMLLEREVPSNWNLYVDGVTFCVENGHISSNGRQVTWSSSGDLGWVEGTDVELNLATPPAGAPWTCGGSGGHALPPAQSAPAQSAEVIGATSFATSLSTLSGPTVTGVEVTSDAGSDDTYGIGDTIQVTLTFSETVNVTGAPRIAIDMDPADWGKKWAAYQGGSGTASLTFTHTVVEPNISTQGIAVLENTLELNGGTILATVDSADAELAHTGLAHDSDHKVDWQTESEAGGSEGQGGSEDEQSSAPTVTGVEVTSDPSSGDTYGPGEVIRISVTFDEAVDVTGTPQLTIDMDPAEWGAKQAAYESGSGSTTLVFAHTVVEPNISTRGIAVLANTLALNGGDIESKATDTDADLSHTGLNHDSDHKVNWRLGAPTVTGVEVTSDPKNGDTYGLGEVIRISVTFDEAVDVTGTPQLTIDMDPAEWGAKQAAYESGSGTTTLVFAHTVVEPNISTQGIAVLANTLTLNGGDIESKATDTDADLSHDGLAHDSDHKVNWQQADDGGPGS